MASAKTIQPAPGSETSGKSSALPSWRRKKRRPTRIRQARPAAHHRNGWAASMLVLSTLRERVRFRAGFAPSSMLGDFVLIDTHDIGRADGHPIPGCRDTHQLILVSAAHDDSRRYSIPFGDLILDLVGDVRERGKEGAEETDSGPAIHLRVAVEVEPVVRGKQGRDPVEVLVVECREEASDYGLVILE